MICAWGAYVNLLPVWMRRDVDKLGKGVLQELRLRIDRQPELVTTSGNILLKGVINCEDLSFCVNAASKYSPWSSTTIQNGFITAEGGHRLGVCGDVSVSDGRIRTISRITSLCLRVACDYPGITQKLPHFSDSLLIIGPPGSGKTTFLRDLVRRKSDAGDGTVAVVDERKELFPVVNNRFCFAPGKATDVLSGCSKQEGIELLLRTMNPRWIAVDEITAQEDTAALIRAGWCGVSLMATAHAESLSDLENRPVYQTLIQSGVFHNAVLLRRDKSWVLERMRNYQ